MIEHFSRLPRLKFSSHIMIRLHFTTFLHPLEFNRSPKRIVRPSHHTILGLSRVWSAGYRWVRDSSPQTSQSSSDGPELLPATQLVAPSYGLHRGGASVSLEECEEGQTAALHYQGLHVYFPPSNCGGCLPERRAKGQENHERRRQA